MKVMFSERAHGQRDFLMFLWHVSSTFDTCLSGGGSWPVEGKGTNLSLGARKETGKALSALSHHSGGVWKGTP